MISLINRQKVKPWVRCTHFLSYCGPLLHTQILNKTCAILEDLTKPVETKCLQSLMGLYCVREHAAPACPTSTHGTSASPCVSPGALPGCGLPVWLPCTAPPHAHPSKWPQHGTPALPRAFTIPCFLCMALCAPPLHAAQAWLPSSVPQCAPPASHMLKHHFRHHKGSTVRKPSFDCPRSFPRF